MSKFLRVVSKVAGVVASVAALVPGGQLVAGIAAGVSAVTGAAAQLTAKPPRAKGQVTNITIGANQPLPYMIGRSYSGGALIHDAGWGGTIDKVDNPYRAMTMVYSGAGPIHALVAIQTDFSTVSFSGNAASGYYSGFLWRDWLDGAGPAPRALAAQWSGEPGWSSAHKLSGFFCAKYSLKFDKKGQAWQAGVPQFGVIADGVKVYDPRFDSTYPGGSGAQRLGTESTYAFSKNPAAHALTYAFGRYQNGKKVFGIGAEIAAIDLANIVAWANLCDANGWEVNGTIFEPGDKWNNLKLIAAAGGAQPVVTAGVLRFDYDAPVVSLDTLTIDDLAEGEISVPATQPFADKLNTVWGSYTSPDHRWEEIATDKISDAGYVAADGEEKAESFAFPLVTDKDQSAQLAAYKLVNSREIGPIVIPAKARFMRYPVGSAFTLALPPVGLPSQLVKVKARTVNPFDGTVELTLATETASKHDFALGKTTTAPPAPSLITPEELDALALSNFQLPSTQFPETAPTNPIVGHIYIDSTGKKFRFDGRALTFYGEPLTFNGEAILPSGYVDAQDQATLQALDDAAAAQADADAALALLAAIDDDAIIDINEKVTTLIPRAASLEATWAAASAAATVAGVSTTTASAKRTAWLDFLAAITPAWDDISQNSPVIRSGLDTVYAEYVDALEEMQAATVEAMTLATSPRIEAPAGYTFTANYLGVLDGGQLPKTFQFKRYRGVTDVSALSTTWTVESQSGIAGGTVTISNGIATIPAGCSISATAQIRVKASRDGLDLFATVALARSDANPPVTGGGGGGTLVSDNTLASISSETKTAISDIMTVKTGAGGTITFSGLLAINAPAMAEAGTFGAVARWRYRPIGGSFSNVGAGDISQDFVALVVDEGGGFYSSESGQIDVSDSITGLAANTDYEVELQAGRDDDTIAKTIGFGGTVYAQGS